MTSAVETKHNPNSERMQSIGKLIALCSFAAMMSTFGPFALVAPAAIALAFIHFGRMKVLGVCLLLTVGIYMLGGQNLNSLGSTGSFLFSFLIGLMIDFFIWLINLLNPLSIVDAIISAFSYKNDEA